MESEASSAGSQAARGATFYVSGASVPMYKLSERMGIPMNLEPIDPPIWRIVRVNHQGSETNVVVRMACRAQIRRTGQTYTVFRLVEESWTSAFGSPRVSRMRLLSAQTAESPKAATLTTLAHQFFHQGDQYLRANRLPEAERCMRRAVCLRPDWASAWNWLGVSVVRQGRVDDAAPIVAQSVLLNPKFVLALTNLADIRRVQGQLGESITLATRATTLAPNDPWAHTVLGHANFANGDFSAAEKQYRAALDLDPGNGGTHADLAGALLRQDKKTEATQEASRALELGWRNHWVYKELAIPK